MLTPLVTEGDINIFTLEVSRSIYCLHFRVGSRCLNQFTMNSRWRFLGLFFGCDQHKLRRSKVRFFHLLYFPGISMRAYSYLSVACAHKLYMHVITPKIEFET
ncbi:hypothetical protein OUZ56_021419 [Daphnia magna]|uniref:Uncharacterized protein n=1 Tax=Daphnia magna TaxID=35525 RepID=A0ABQ9ZHD8_9CRUS|nr:hypothetical protein OUZ56_021419 [Daphnia magna]